MTYMTDADRAELIEKLAAHPNGHTADDYSRYSNGQVLNEAAYLGITSL